MSGFKIIAPMRAALLGGVTAIAITGCATNEDPKTASEPPDHPALDVIGTPFLWAFRLPVCVASAAIGAPVAGAYALSPPDRQATEEQIGADLDANCGPPYVMAY